MAKEPEVAALPSVEPEATQADLERWYVIAKQMEDLKEEEMKLRKLIFGTFFKDPKEGVNSHPMTEGFVLKGGYTINRKIIPEQVTALMEEFKKAKIPVKELIVQKPELSVKNYRLLTDEQRKLFDRALDIKPGAPALEIVKPKRQ